MRPLAVRAGTIILAWLWPAIGLAIPCLGAITPKPRARPAGKDQSGIQIRGVGEDFPGFVLFITLAVILALAHFTSRWLVSAFAVSRPAVIGGIAGALIASMASFCMHQFMGWPWIPSQKTLFPDGLCLMFGIVYGRRSAVEESKRISAPIQ